MTHRRERPTLAAHRRDDLGVIEPAPPPDARDLHGYVDAPRHRVLITVGWVTSGVCLLAGLGSLVILAAPSDPCSPGMEDCGPDQATASAGGHTDDLVASRGPHRAEPDGDPGQ